MHHCLEIQEILAEIFQYISRDRRDGLRARSPADTLAGLARTCQSFTDPATDLLWHTQPADLFNLVNCLPQHAVEVVPESSLPIFLSRSKLAVKQDTIRPEDFSRVLYYSTKIKVMSNSRFASYHTRRVRGSGCLTDDALNHIQQAKPCEGPLVPNVTELEVLLDYFKAEASFPRLVIGGALKSMKVVYRDAPTTPIAPLITLAEVLATVSPPPSSLKLTMEDEYERHIVDSPPAIVELLPSLTNLTFLDINSLKLTGVGISFLSTLPVLEKLSINITDINLALPPVIQPTTLDVKRSFPSLKYLFIVTELLSSVSQIVTRWPAHRLERFVVERYYHPQVWDLEEFFDALSKSYRNSHPLKELILYNNSSEDINWGPDEDNIIISAAIFRSLGAQLHNLTQISISINASYDIDDVSLMEIAKGWPALQNLCLEERTFGIESSKVTPVGLLAFVVSCPHLEKLTLRFNVTKNFPPPEQTVFSPSLRHLDVCTSPVDDADVVAAFIKKSFPSLKTLKYGWVYQHPYNDGETIQFHEEDVVENFYKDTWDKVFESLGRPR